MPSSRKCSSPASFPAGCVSFDDTDEDLSLRTFPEASSSSSIEVEAALLLQLTSTTAARIRTKTEAADAAIVAALIAAPLGPWPENPPSAGDCRRSCSSGLPGRNADSGNLRRLLGRTPEKLLYETFKNFRVWGRVPGSGPVNWLLETSREMREISPDMAAGSLPEIWLPATSSACNSVKNLNSAPKWRVPFSLFSDRSRICRGELVIFFSGVEVRMEPSRELCRRCSSWRVGERRSSALI